MISLADTERSHRLATFRIGEEWFGIDVMRVQEVLTRQPVTSVPLAPDYVDGLINVRGLIVTCINIKHRMGFSDDGYDDEHFNIIVPDQDATLSLLVDEVGDVVMVRDADRTERPPTVAAHHAHFIAGVYRMEQHLLIELDIEALCAP